MNHCDDKSSRQFMLNLESVKMYYSGYQNDYPSYGDDGQDMSHVTEAQYSRSYQQPSSQYYVPHQNDKTSSSSKLGFLNSIPSSITVTKEKVRIPSPVKNQDDHDDDFFNVHLTYDEMGMEDVTVEGNKKLFIKTIHDELLNFLKTYAVPLKSVCFHILSKSNDKELKEFFSRKEWDYLRREEKLLYHRLNDWVSEPVTSRVLNLINIETDTARIETLTEIYNKLAPQTSTTSDSLAPVSQPPPPSPEVQEIPQEIENVPDDNIPQPHESDMELLAKLQANVAPGPPRTKTTEEERKAVKEWGLRNPNADANQRKELAASLGLTKLTVDRLVVYANKSNNSNYRLVDSVKPNGKATLLVPQRTKVDINKMDNVRSLVKKVNDPNSTAPQSSQLPSKSITDAIKNAVKAGNLKGVDFKKPLKIVVMPPKDNTKAQLPQTPPPQQQQVTAQNNLGNTAQNNKFNEVALTSYFKNKPFPTEEEINYFVECTRVPLDVTKNYVEKLQELFKEKVKSESPEKVQKDQHLQENLQEDYSQGIQEQQQISEHQQQYYPPNNQQFYPEQIQQYSQMGQQYSQGDNEYSQVDHQYSQSDHQYSQDQNQYQTEPPLDGSYPQENLNQARYPDNSNYVSDVYNSDTAFIDQQASASGSHHGSGLIPELSLDQKRMFQDFIQRNPRPEMQDIVGFAEEMGMAFENVLLTLELDFNIFNNSPSHEQQDDKAHLFASLDPEISQLLNDIQEFKGDKFSPILEQELKSMFGNKIFCTVDNVKSFALAKNLNFANIYKRLSSNNDSVMLVSDETCKRLLDAATGNENPGFGDEIHNEPGEPGVIKKESPAQDWMTSSELNFENMQSEGEYVEYEESSPKRKFSDQEFSENKRIKLEQPPTDDSGYGVSDVSQTEDSFDVKNDDSGDDILGDLITENIGEVNMLNDSLDLFNDSISNVDLVNDLFQKVESQNSQSVAPKPVSEIEYGNILASLENSEHRPEIRRKKVKGGDLRKLFQGPIQNFSPALQVVSFKPSFKPYIFEVELSDGRETSDNFFFKSGAADLKPNLVIKLKAVRYVGSKICVDSFEIVEHRNTVIGDPQPIETEFFENLRETRIDPLDECDLTPPVTILDYISLQENLISFIENSRFNLEDLKENCSIETKKEILYKLCSSLDGKVPSKSLKILSRFLQMNKSDIEAFLFRMPRAVSSVSVEHSYCNMYKTLHQ